MPDDQSPSRTVRLDEKDWDKLPDTNVTKYGQAALDANPKRWKHAETNNYILHYRRITEARKVARELEYNIWFVASALDADLGKSDRKAHAFIFEDEQEWREFVVRMDLPDWSSSLAVGQELFLNVRATGADGRFDSATLAHEATHAVVARLYPAHRWPTWLNEGFAEFMSAASVADRKNQTLGRHQRRLDAATIPLEQLIRMETYPANPDDVAAYYQSSERLVRFLMQELPANRFSRFIDELLANGGDFQKALLAVYGDKLTSYDDFAKGYAKFES